MEGTHTPYLGQETGKAGTVARRGMFPALYGEQQCPTNKAPCRICKFLAVTIFATPTLKISKTPDSEYVSQHCSKGSQGGTTGLAVLASGGMFPRDLDPILHCKDRGTEEVLGSVPLGRSEWRPALELIPGIVPAGDAGRPQGRSGTFGLRLAHQF
ncbi:uncharacterized protein CLUP02_15207 [Colletotrichum lupini]|uniref:Uncharacterized protein n=1 Tax=Colletotrichum lupini TaxID=145971 RepID=A0A9Q8WNG8_9PEZI|nr:uncharacterized protein CLUP02_15207 [Colletotrichum lupini]UQC89676.1 hypothetical protein CLUP02_15207 [Colletotrichum lupini]